MPDDDNQFDSKDVHVYMEVDGECRELHGLSKFPIYLGGNRAWRRAKPRNPRDHDKFYRKDQIRPWVN